jgi:hypothetical protein
METYNKRQLVKEVESWCIANRKNWQDFANAANVSYVLLLHMKNNYRGTSKVTGDSVAAFFKVGYKSTQKKVTYNFSIADGSIEKIKRVKSKADKKSLAVRHAIEAHQEKLRTNDLINSY